MNIGLGTAAIGRPQYINVRTKPGNDISFSQFKENGMALLNRAYAHGVRYFDTAPGYGLAETLLGEWLSTHDDPTIRVATKWGYTYVANFDPDAKIHEVKEHSVTKLNEQWNQSKQLLPYLNLYQIHSATLDSGVLDNDDIHHRLHELKISHNLKIGLTSTGVDQRKIIEKALEINIAGQPLIDSFQITYNIFDQSLDSMIPILKSENRQVIIKEALANGRVFISSSANLLQLSQLAKKYDVGIDAVALRFCQDSIQPDMVLSGASLIDHLEGNLQALNFHLSEEEVHALKGFAKTPETYWNERKKLAWN